MFCLYISELHSGACQFVLIVGCDEFKVFKGRNVEILKSVNFILHKVFESKQANSFGVAPIFLFVVNYV